MSVQEGLVSTALRCLQITQKAFRCDTQSSRRPSCPPHTEYWDQGLHTNDGDHKLQALQLPQGAFQPLSSEDMQSAKMELPAASYS